MPNLQTLLKDSDSGVLQAIAETWGVSLKSVAQSEAVPTLQNAMLEAPRAEAIYDKLTHAERGALQALLSSKNYQMPEVMFSRMYGDLTKMGAGKIEKDQPHKKPKTATDGLFYRGLLGEIRGTGNTGILNMLYLPEELVGILPFHKTSYDKLEDDTEAFSGEYQDEEEDDTENEIEVVPDAEVANIHAADTSCIDDMTTLLAYLRLNTAAVEGDTFFPIDMERLLPFMVKPDAERVTMLLCMGVSGELIDVREGRAYVRRDGLQRWFGLPRWGQVKLLAQAWLTSVIYQELYHVPDLFPDPQGFDYDPVIARQAIVDFLAKLPPARAWFGIESFIAVIKESDPDFQRPNGDYSAWYIRNARNEYLTGFESWDAVEGNLIEFVLTGPLYWLGLVDIGDDVVRLNAYGRAFVGVEAFPQPADPDDKITIRDDGTAIASRKVPRSDRFTLARIATWVKADLFTYRFEPRSLERAIREQNISAGQIEAFLKKQLDPKPIPSVLLRMITTAQQGPVAQVSLERLIVLRALSEEVMHQLYEEPAFRRYMGARLGTLACVVLPDTAEELRQKLEQQGIRVEWNG